MNRIFIAVALALVSLLSVGTARAAASSGGDPHMAAQVKAEFLHAWRGYERYAWSHDDLRPLSKTPYDWYGQSLEMTPVDALDTLVLMGLNKDADKDRRLIDTRLSFDKDVYVKTFEITIRLLGGLLSGYELTGDKRLLALAEDLGARLLPAFDSPTGLPWRYVNLKTGAVKGADSNPAETGTLILEFGTLSRLTGNPVFYKKAKHALAATFARRSPIGLVGDGIDIKTGKWTGTDSHVSGGIDSYYEYQLKCWVLFRDPDCRHMWQASIGAINKYLADEVNGRLWYGHADMNTGKRTATEYGALDAFFPAALALGGELDRAQRLQDSSFAMWNLYGIEPEVIDYRDMKVEYPGYQLRPEIVESTYYLYHYTHDPKYLAMGRAMFRDFVKYCRTKAGYAALSSEVTKKQQDRMESYVFAETFKYFYLLFAPPATLDFDKVVFNTEGHPLRRAGPYHPGAATKPASDPVAEVNPLIGTANGGNTFPGADTPFGMFQWSPEETAGDHLRTVAAGGYKFAATRIRGFSLTHLSGTGCRGASGDVPFMPYTGKVRTSPAADSKDAIYASDFAHDDETAQPGYYAVKLRSGVSVALAAATRVGVARLEFPQGKPATLLIRTSDSEVGSSDARVTIHPAERTVTGRVTSGNFCGYIDAADRRSYYTLYFVARFDRPFADVGTWRDGKVAHGTVINAGGTGWDAKGIPVQGKGSGAWVGFNIDKNPLVNVRVGISYVSLANAAANLRAEAPPGISFDAVRHRSYAAWNRALGRIRVAGGTPREHLVFYTALYHSLLHPNVFSDANGEYRGFDGKVHKLAAGQGAQYANFSGWDVYRSQLQLIALLDPATASDMAQSLYNQAQQNGGDWDRWTHNSGATHVMEGDPSPAALADVVAFGGTHFDMKDALASLVRAASVPTAADGSVAGCPVECVGERPALADWLKLHYIPAQAAAWGGAGETLEDATAEFAIAQLADRTGDEAVRREFLQRAQYWRNVFNPHSGYAQNRNADGSWSKLDPASDDGFAEGSAAQYTWMVPFDVRGLFDIMGGAAAAERRLDAFFHGKNGLWAFTNAGGLHAEMANEPSIATPWLYDFAGAPYKTQETVRAVMDSLWSDSPGGIPGNDDLGEMSSWYVWAALGMYPEIPGRAELVLASPLFPQLEIRRANGVKISIRAPKANKENLYVKSLTLNGKPWSKPWLPESFVANGGSLDYVLAAKPDTSWGAASVDAPPSFGDSH